MPLTGSEAVLSALIKSKRLAADVGAVDNDAMQADCDAIAEAVIQHITANAVLAVIGVTPGGGAAGGTIT